MTKRLLATLLVMTLLLSCAAFAEGENGPFTPMQEEITLRVAMGYTEGDKPGLTPEDCVWNDMFKHYLNVNLEWMWVVPNDQYETKMATSIASGDIPDIMRASYTQFRYFKDADYLKSLDEAWEKFGSQPLKDMNALLNNSMLDDCTVDGTLYALPRGDDNRVCTSMLWLRNDWLENLNIQAPTDLDSLLEVMRAFTFNDPDGNGENDTYGFGMYGDMLSQHMNAYGVFNAFSAYPGGWIMKDNQVVNGSVQTEAKEALDWLRAAYAEGLIDPEFATLSSELLLNNISQGKIGMTNGRWYTYDGFKGPIESDWNADWYNYPMVTAEAGVPASSLIPEKMTTEYNIVTGAAPEGAEEALVKMCNLFFDLHFQTAYPDGASDHDYLADGYSPNDMTNTAFQDRYVWHWSPVIQWNVPANAQNVEGYKEYFETGVIAPRYSNQSPEKLTAIRDYWLLPDAEKTRDPNVYADWFIAYIRYNYFVRDGASYEMIVDLWQDGYVVDNVNYGPETETGEQVGSTLNDYVVEYYCRYIMGSVEQDSWDKFVADWNDMGGAKWTEEVNAAYAENH